MSFTYTISDAQLKIKDIVWCITQRTVSLGYFYVMVSPPAFILDFT